MKFIVVALNVFILSLAQASTPVSKTESKGWDCVYGDYFFSTNAHEGDVTLKFGVCNEHPCQTGDFKEAKLTSSSRPSGLYTYEFADASGIQKIELRFKQEGALSSAKISMAGADIGDFDGCYARSYVE